MDRQKLLTGAAGLALVLGLATSGQAREIPALAELEGAGEDGYTGAQQILQAYPEVTLIHNANTAMAMGSLSAVQEIGSDVLITAWGGTGDEIEALRLGELWATPMRMSDDVGVATAEIIRADLEGRTDEVPLVFLARISIATGTQGAEEVDAMEAESFRYTGVGTLER